MAASDTAEKKPFFSRFKLDSHHAIERFGFLFAFFAVTLVFITGGALASSVNNTAAKADVTAVYTPEFTTSKTELSGDVVGLYVSPDRFRALVLMKFDDNKSGSFSVDASNYQAFITGSTAELRGEPIKSDVSGELVMFGTTGYMGVILESDRPFAQQVLSLTLRANSELIYNEPDSKKELRADLAGQQSFADYDQWRLFINPGGSDAIETDALSGRQLDMSEIYYDLLIADREKTVRASMESQLEQLRVDIAKINEYTAQLATTQVGGVFIVPPAIPAQVAGDEITGEPGTAPVEQTGATATPKPTPTPRMEVAEDGSMIEVTDVDEEVVDGSTLELETDWVIPTGYSFDWRDRTVWEGYLDALVPPDMSYITFLTQKSKLGDTYEGDDDFVPSRLPWMLTDDTDLLKDYTASASAKTMKPLVDIKDNLVQAYTSYYKNKTTYQTQGYNELIDLEVELRNADSGISTNTTDEALVTY